MTNHGSYKVDQLNNVDAEMERLAIQAKLLKPLESKILKETGLLPQHRVLEVGCGPGFVTSILAELASEGQIFATDTDEQLLALCKKNVTHPPKSGLTTINTNKTSLDTLESSIDFSYLRFVLQHSPQRKQLVEQVYGCLKPGGTICALDSDDGLVVQFPEDNFIKELLMDAKEKQQQTGGDRMVGRKLSCLLSESGFKNIQNRVLSFTSSDLPFAFLARIIFGFKSEISGRSHEIAKWIKDTAPKIEAGKYFLSAGVVLTTGKK